jgi:hypothetical protein
LVKQLRGNQLATELVTRAAMGDHAAECLSRKEQVRQFGIDCGEGICYRGGTWAPGGEYIQKLRVKNVSTKTQKFKYQLPKSRYFSMEFPEPITLSAGTSIDIDVVFRPTVLEEYDDAIGIHIHYVKAGLKGAGGHFFVPVRANLAKLHLEAPPGIDFGFQPTAEIADLTFPLTNLGELPARFKWNVAPPFSLNPSQGMLESGETAEITCTLMPTDASVFVGQCTCEYVEDTEEGDQSDFFTMKMSAIGKYAFISISDTNLDFNKVLIGAPSTPQIPTEKEFVIKNPSLVHATWEIREVEHDHGDHGPVFFFSVKSGVIEPESEQEIKVKYVPLSTGEFSCNRYDFVTPGGCTKRITCKGTAMGPEIELKKNEAVALLPGAVVNETALNSVNFGDVRVGELASRIIFLHNNSSVPAHYSFVVEDKGQFNFERTTGTIPPMLNVGIKLEFAPGYPGNYHRCVTCLIQNQLPVNVDLLGTGYNAKERPCPLLQSHIDAFRLRAHNGLQRMGPVQLEDMLEDPRLAKRYLVGPNKNAGATLALTETYTDPLLTRSGESSQAHREVMRRFFIDPDDPSLPITINTKQLNFGATSHYKMPESKVVTLTNHTKAKVIVSWRCPDSDDGDTEKDFEVYPEQADIPAGSSMDFKVQFKPSQENFYYCQEIEAFVIFKAARNFRLVNPKALSSPWCVTTRVIGHTFPPFAEQFLAKVSFTAKNNRICFPPCQVGDELFQTFAMHNTGDTPAQFQFLDDPAGIYSCKPKGGLIPVKDFVLVAVRFAPKATKKYNHRFEVVLNNNEHMTASLDLVGNGCECKLAFDDLSGSTLFFKPTARGIVARRKLTVTNTSRIPLAFKCRIPPKYRGILFIQPSVGRLRGNESMPLVICFAPRAEQHYGISVPFDVQAISGDGGLEPTGPELIEELSLSVVGVGTSGAVTFDPPMIDFGTTLVKTIETKEFMLVNSSDCDLMYELEVAELGELDALDQNDDGIVSGNELDQLQKARALEGQRRAELGIPQKRPLVKFNFKKGVLEARARKKILCTFQPADAGIFEFSVFCEIVCVDKDGKPIKMRPPSQTLKMETTGRQSQEFKADPLSCQMIAKASFPTLVLEDARSPDVSTDRLWTQLAITPLNFELATPLTADEIAFNLLSNVDTSHLPKFDIMFMPAPVGSMTQEVLLGLRNPGKLAVDFNIKYPNESDVELEQWADEGEPTPEALRLNKVIDHKIFEMSPRKGRLEAFESMLLRIRYHYKMTGDHDLPVLLQVAKGKQLTLVLRGKTLEPAQPQLVLPSQVFKLKPIRIGENDPPIQSMELRNTGASDLQYEVTLDEVSKLNRANYNFEVLTCVNPTGTIEAFSRTMLNWRFCPLQSKQYSVPVVVNFRGIDTDDRGSQKLLLNANGYHPGTGPPVEEVPQGGLMEIPTGPPKQQKLVLPWGLGSLSLDRLEFGEVPAKGVKHQLVVIRNTHQVNEVEFKWDTNHPLCAEGLVKLVPAAGRLTAGQHMVVKVTFIAKGKPVVLDDDIQCVLEEIIPPPPMAKAGSTRGSRMGGLSTRGTTAGSMMGSMVSDRAPTEINPVKEVAKIGTRPYVSVAARTTKSKAPKERLKAADAREAARLRGSSAGSGGNEMGGSRAGSAATIQGGGSSRGMTGGMTAGNVAMVGASQPVVCYLHVTAEVVELEAYRTTHPGDHSFHIPLQVVEEEGVAGTAAQAVEPRARLGGGNQQELESEEEYARAEAKFGLDVTALLRTTRKKREEEEAEKRVGDTKQQQLRLAANGEVSIDDQQTLAKGVITSLLRDIVGSEDVRESCMALPEEADTPFFYNFRQVTSEEEDGSAAETREALLADIEAADKAAQEGKRKTLLQDPECQELVSKVVENTIFNLLQDASHGEFKLTKVPKRFMIVD